MTQTISEINEIAVGEIITKLNEVLVINTQREQDILSKIIEPNTIADGGKIQTAINHIGFALNALNFIAERKAQAETAAQMETLQVQQTAFAAWQAQQGAQNE